MSGYRRGAILGLTVAETFILLAFLLLVALLGLVSRDEPLAEPDTESPPPPRVWVRPDEIETLVKAAEAARKKLEEAEQARTAVERERDQAQEQAEAARKAREQAERARTTAERERDRAQEQAEAARKAHDEAEQARAAVERERDQAQEQADVAHKARDEAEQARAAAEHARDQIKRDLALLHRKGKNPPCWYQIVSAGEDRTREKAYYAFDVAILENSIVLAPRSAPPGGADDDGGGPYADEWKRLRIGYLPYGRELSDNEFSEAVRDLVAQGRNGQVRTYECVFSVRVWDKTPDHAKKRWKEAHDQIIEASFSAYTVRDDEWTGVEVMERAGIPRLE